MLTRTYELRLMQWNQADYVVIAVRWQLFGLTLYYHEVSTVPSDRLFIR